MLEKTLEHQLVREASRRKGLAVKLSSVGFAGLPDRLLLFPGGRMLFVELKAPGKKPRALQLYMHRKLRALGFVVKTIDSQEGIKEVMDYAVSSPSISADGH